ncbi:MAG: MFS transporter [Nanoarchaeota archaeon]|nr:MFS transporter [Nanoarchaeota archaeon]
MKINYGSYYVYKMLVDGVNFTTPFIIIYLLRYVSMGQIILLNALQFMVVALLEIPSGAFADVIGRRESLMIGAIVGGFSTLSFLVGDSFVFFLIAYFFAGLSTVLISGSYEPLLYTSLEKKKEVGKATKIFGRTEEFALKISDLTFLVGSGLAALNLRFVFLAELLKWPLIFLVSRRMPKNRKKFKKNFKPYYLRIRSTAAFLSERKSLTFVIVIAAIILSIFTVTSQYHQPLMSAAGINVAFFGIIYVIFNQARSFSTRLAYLLEASLTPKQILLVTMAVKGFALVSLSIFVSPIAVILLLLTKIGVEGFRKPFFTSYLNKVSPTQNRSTILSFSSFVHSLSFIFLSVIFKLLTDSFSMYLAIFVSGVSLLLLFPLFKIKSFDLEVHTKISKKS